MSLARREDDELARRSQGRFSRGGLETRPDVRPHSSQRADHAARLVVAPPHLRAYHRGGVGAPRSPAPSGARSNCRPLTPRNTQPRRAPAVVARARRGARRPLRHHRRGPLRSLPHLALPLTSSSPSQHPTAPAFIYDQLLTANLVLSQTSLVRQAGCSPGRPRQRTQHHAPRPASRRSNPRPKRQCHECHRPGGVRHRAAAGSGNRVPRVHAGGHAKPPSPTSASRSGAASRRRRSPGKNRTPQKKTHERRVGTEDGDGDGVPSPSRPRPRPRLRGRRFARFWRRRVFGSDDAASRCVDAPAPDNLTLTHPAWWSTFRACYMGSRTVPSTSRRPTPRSRYGGARPAGAGVGRGRILVDAREDLPGDASTLAASLVGAKRSRPPRAKTTRQRDSSGTGLGSSSGWVRTLVLILGVGVTSRSFGEYRGATVRRGA